MYGTNCQQRTKSSQLDVSEVLNLAGWEMNIVFNPQTLSVVSITEGDFLKRTGNTLF